MSGYKDIKVSKEGAHILVLTLNRPKKYNAMSFEMMAELEQALLKEVTDDIRVVVLRAEGKHFTAGIDLHSAASIGEIGKSIDGDDEEEADASRKAIKIYDLVLRL